MTQASHSQRRQRQATPNGSLEEGRTTPDTQPPLRSNSMPGFPLRSGSVSGSCSFAEGL